MTTISAGQVPRQPTYWDDLTQVFKVLQPDGTYALGSVAILYSSSGLPWPGVTMQSQRFTLSATGTVVSAVALHRIKVYAVKLIVSAAISVNFRDGGSTLLEDPQPIAANGGFVENVDPPAFLYGTSAGNTLDLVISGSGTASGRVSYWADDLT